MSILKGREGYRETALKIVKYLDCCGLLVVVLTAAMVNLLIKI